jgi:hypothetical protein
MNAGYWLMLKGYGDLLLSFSSHVFTQTIFDLRRYWAIALATRVTLTAEIGNVQNSAGRMITSQDTRRERASERVSMSQLQ